LSFMLHGTRRKAIAVISQGLVPVATDAGARRRLLLNVSVLDEAKTAEIVCDVVSV
jgi:hypothetical protein